VDENSRNSVTQITPSLDLAVDAGNYLGESPLWSAEEQALYWINCEQPAELLRWRPDANERRSWPMPARIGGFVLKQAGGVLAVLADGIYDLDLESGALELRLRSPLEHAALHECACDRQGRLWVGGIDHRLGSEGVTGGGSLFRLDGDQLVEVEAGISCSNGLAFSLDGRTLYHSDAPTKVVHAWDLDPTTGTLSGKREFFRLGPDDGYCDGATVDAEDGYWVALVFAGKLRRYLPSGGIDVEVALPFAAPTKPAFGGPDLSTLYLTTTRLMLASENDRLSGGVFSFRPGVKGLEEPRLRS
jgi:sugar lactone lactonase YvrE